MSKIGELLNKEVANIPMDELCNLWDETFSKLGISWRDQLVQEIACQLTNLGFSVNTAEYDANCESELPFTRNGVIGIIYVDYPNPYDGQGYFDLSGYLERQVSSTTTLSYELKADTITELMIQVQIKADLLEEEDHWGMEEHACKER